MGCDIHAVIERRTEHGWVADLSCEADESRNYKRFAALASVRGEGLPPAEFQRIFLSRRDCRLRTGVQIGFKILNNYLNINKGE